MVLLAFIAVSLSSNFAPLPFLVAAKDGVRWRSVERSTRADVIPFSTVHCVLKALPHYASIPQMDVYSTMC